MERDITAFVDEVPLFDPEKLKGIAIPPDTILVDGELHQVISEEPKLPVPDKTWSKIYEIARVGPYGPVNREERRRVDKVLRRLAKRGLTIG